MGLFDRVKDLLAATGAERQAPAVKPGRNDPCWCGSGKKYKKCHLPDELDKAAEKACGLNCGPT